MRTARRGSADEERQVEALALHLRGHVHHFVERRSDQSGQTNDIDPVGARFGEDFFAGHHHADVDDFVAVAGQNDADDVLADVVDIAFDRGHEDFSLGAGVGIGRALALHVRGEPGDRLFHHAGAFHDLRKEHFPLAEEVADDLHAVHQRTFNHVERARVFLARFFGVLVDVIDDAFDQGVGQTVLHGRLAPFGVFFDGGLARALDRFGESDQTLGGVGATVEQDILDQLEQVGRDFGVNAELAGIDDAHVESGLDRVVKEGRVHGLADRIVAAERKGNVAHPAADPRVGQVLFDPARGLDEIDSVVVVLLDAGGHGEDVRIENDVFRREADFLDEDLVGAAADFFAALEVVRLTLFVEGHDNHGRAVTHDLTGLFLEFLLPLFERDGVHHTLALHAAEAGFDHLELRGVDHDRDLRDIRLAGDKLEEFGHGRRSIEHPLVHVDVDDLRAGLDLLTRHGERFVVLVAEDELGEFRRAGDVGAFADVDERDFGARGEGFESAQTQSARASRNAARLEIARRFDNGRNVIRRRAAASADNV